MPAVGARVRAESACRALLTLGGSAKTKDVTALAPDMFPNPSRKAEAFNYAVKEGWLVRSDAGRFITLTDYGRSVFSGTGVRDVAAPVVASVSVFAGKPVPADLAVIGSALGELRSRLPSAHWCFTWLMLCATVAKYHLRDSVNDQWTSFVAIGETGTGKTTVHNIVCRLFGFNTIEHMALMTEAQTRGTLIGGTRSVTIGFQPSPYMELPYLCIDELDKANRIESVIDPYMHGTVNHMTRGVPYAINPVTLCLANPPENSTGPERYSIIHEAWRRRSVFMDIGNISDTDRERIAEIADMTGVPYELLSLESFTVPRALNSTGLAVIKAGREIFTKNFHRIYPGSRAIELLTLGHMALTGDSPGQAAYLTVSRFATVTASIRGQLVPGAGKAWKSVADFVSDDPDKMIAVIRETVNASAQTNHVERARDAEIRERRNRQLRMQFTASKNTLIAQVRQFAERFNPGDLPDNDPLVSQALLAYYHILALIPEIKEYAIDPDTLSEMADECSALIDKLSPYSIPERLASTRESIEIAEQQQIAIARQQRLALESADDYETDEDDSPSETPANSRADFVAILRIGQCSYKHFLSNRNADYWFLPSAYMWNPAPDKPIVKSCTQHYANAEDYCRKLGHAYPRILSGDELRRFVTR